MKTKLILCALIVFTLAAALRLEAKTITTTTISGFVDISSFGGPLDLSDPVGPPKPDSQGHLYQAFGTGDSSAAPTLYNGGVAEYSGFGTVVGDWNGDGVITQVIVHPFAGGSDGAYASTGVKAAGVQVFGATSGGGDAGVGVFYALDTGTGVNMTSSFAAPAAMDVNATEVRVVQNNDGSENLLFVLVSQQTGGSKGMGAVLKMSPSGKLFVQTPVHDFNGDDGEYPIIGEALSFELPLNGQTTVKTAGVKSNGPIPGANSYTNYTLYGVTFFGGTNGNGPGTGGYGTVFKVNDDGSGFQTFHVFASGQNATNGYGPAGGMALSGNTLYGTTSGGGKNGTGTLLKIDTSGSNFMVLKSFSAYGSDSSFNYTNSDGMAPEGDLIISGDTLYGTTLEGGTNGGGGVVFSVKTNGNNFTVLHSFSNPVNNGSGVYTNSGGGGTRAGLTLTGHVLFGTTPYGGIYGGGTLFAMAAFSAGSPKASQPMGCRTFLPFIRMNRDSTSPMV